MILRSISLGCFALALIASSRAEEFKDGLAKGILEAYAKDPRGIFAKHAQAVLKMKR